MKKVLEELTNVDETAVGKTFPSLSRTGIRQVRSKFKRCNHNISKSCQALLKKQNYILQNNLYNLFDMILVTLNNTKRKYLRILHFLPYVGLIKYTTICKTRNTGMGNGKRLMQGTRGM